MAKKPAPQPVRKPAPKPTPKPAPLDLVRNPNFNAAMSRQNYDNLIKEQRTRMEADRSGAGAARSGSQDFIDSRDPNSSYTADMVDYIDPATGEKTSRTRGVVPAPGSRFVPVERFQTPNLMPIGGSQSMPPAFYDVGRGLPSPKIMEEMQRRKDEHTLMPIGQFSPEQMQNLSPERRQALEQRMAIEQFQRNLPNQMPVNGQNATAYQRNAGGSLVPVQAPRPIQGDYDTTGRPVGVQPNLPSNFIGQVPQNAQMQNYNNFLQQGMQNSNTLNQGAMANFANMQPGMQAPQAGIGQTQRPNMPNMGMQQRRPNPAPRKFSTVNTPSARFG